MRVKKRRRLMENHVPENRRSTHTKPKTMQNLELSAMFIAGFLILGGPYKINRSIFFIKKNCRPLIIYYKKEMRKKLLKLIHYKVHAGIYLEIFLFREICCV